MTDEQIKRLAKLVAKEVIIELEVREMDNIQKVENIKLAKDRNKFAIQNLYISFCF